MPGIDVAVKQILVTLSIVFVGFLILDFFGLEKRIINPYIDQKQQM